MNYLSRRTKQTSLTSAEVLSSWRSSLKMMDILELTALRARRKMKAGNNTDSKIPPLLIRLWLWKSDTLFGVMLICAWRDVTIQYQKAFQNLSQARNISYHGLSLISLFVTTLAYPVAQNFWELKFFRCFHWSEFLQKNCSRKNLLLSDDEEYRYEKTTGTTQIEHTSFLFLWGSVVVITACF